MRAKERRYQETLQERSKEAEDDNRMERLGEVLVENIVDEKKLGLPKEVRTAEGGLKVIFTGLTLRVKGATPDARPVLSKLTGTIKACEITALMGPSGCGKSSLMNVITGSAKNYADTEGDVLFRQCGVVISDVCVYIWPLYPGTKFLVVIHLFSSLNSSRI